MHRRALLAALFLGAALVALGLGALPLLEPDEGRYADLARSVEGGALLPRLDGITFHDKPPLVPWLVGFAFAALGHGEAVARLVPAVLGWLGIALAAWLGEAIGTRRASWLAALLLLGSPLWLGLSKFLTLDAVFATLVTGAWLFHLRGAGAFGHPVAWRWSLLAGVLLALATLTKGPVALAIVGLAALLLAALERDAALLVRASVPWLLGLVLALPWFEVLWLRDPDGLRAFLVDENVGRFLGWHEHQHSPAFYLGTFLWGAGPLGLLIMMSTAGSGRAPDLRAKRAGARGLAVLALVVFLVFSLASSKVESYILPAFPALAALAGSALDRSLSVPQGRARLVRASLLASALVLIAPLGWLVFAHLGPSEGSEHVALVAGSAGRSAAFALLALPLALAAILSARRGRASAATGLTLAAASVALVSLLPVFETIATWRSAAPVASLMTERKPGERVVAFRTYLRGLPFYLNEPVALALTVSELPRPEVERERPDLLLADEPQVFALFSERKPILVVVSPGSRGEEQFLSLARRAGATKEQGTLIMRGHAAEEIVYELFPH